MRVFVDDVRPLPAGFDVLCRSVEGFKLLLRTGKVIFASLDHDMGACRACTITGQSVGDMRTPETTYTNWCPHADDGTKLVNWMEQTGHWPVEKPVVHSMNPVGAARMRAVIDKHYGR
jgi:hypothetical protein